MPTLAPERDAARDAGHPAGPARDAGPLLFARYAFGPNRLGLCGPDEPAALLEAGAARPSDARGRDAGTASRRASDRERLLRELARGFEGAYPYLELIADAASIPDPLDRRVVEAYWLGGPPLDRVGPRRLGASLERRFRPRLRRDPWRWLATTPEAGARPVHAFHVLDVFPKLGLLRGEASPGVLETIDSCRIRWGTVEGVDGDWLDVASPAVRLVDGHLELGEPERIRVRASLDGVGFLPAVAPGDSVSTHWSWACDRLTPGTRAALEASTRRELEIANRTL